jgi:hypothetical protein
MKNDNIQSNQRGSSPPLLAPEQDFIKWMNDLKSMSQPDEKSLHCSNAKLPSDPQTKSSDLTDDFR